MRGLYNIDDVLVVLRETGLPVRVINDMGALTWEEQVDAMAQTGILVAVHGAALTNVIFMPTNAVLIEVRACCGDTRAHLRTRSAGDKQRRSY